MSRPKILYDVDKELDQARVKFPEFTSLHQGWALIHEETEELWELVRKWHGHVDPPARDDMKKECIQIAAMAMRFVEDLLEEEPGA